MERGDLGVVAERATVFIFDGLIAHLLRPRTYRALINLRRWEFAMDLWEFDQRACDYVYSLMSRHNVPVDVITWQPPEMAELIRDRIWDRHVPVREVRSSSYGVESPHIAMDPSITAVFDPDPAHRTGYGFKCRDFDYRTI